MKEIHLPAYLSVGMTLHLLHQLRETSKCKRNRAHHLYRGALRIDGNPVVVAAALREVKQFRYPAGRGFEPAPRIRARNCGNEPGYAWSVAKSDM
jgi:hypothetical protein